ncbi:MAG: hypothetical protein IPK07_32745 [Deltaproteobacteria bacterium]|nr:hypothetical protein [Deltaproteobacteria bacterium]
MRFATGAAFTAIGAGLWLQEDDVHILMCGLGALGFGLGQLWLSCGGQAKTCSFFAGWMLVYTVWIGSAMLVLIPELRNTPEPMAWAYHLLVTAVLLGLFAVDELQPHATLAGTWGALLSTPFMLYLTSVQPVLTLDDPRPVIPVCAAAGLALMLAHLRAARSQAVLAEQLGRLRRTWILGLILFGLATLVTFASLA